MTTPTTEQPSSLAGQDSDYDGAWKEALRKFLRAILECYFPAVAAAVDGEHPPEWYDKGLSQILGQTGRRNRTVDVLADLREGWLPDEDRFQLADFELCRPEQVRAVPAQRTGCARTTDDRCRNCADLFRPTRTIRCRCSWPGLRLRPCARRAIRKAVIAPSGNWCAIYT